MLKYLYGKLPVTSTLNQGSKEKIGRASALLFSVRCDKFQHRDMEFATAFIPFNGGFGNLHPTDPARHFYGESISCNVQTDLDVIDKMIKLKETGNVFYTHPNDSKHRVFAIIEKGVGCPCKTGRAGDWIPCSLQEMETLCNEERSTFPY